MRYRFSLMLGLMLLAITSCTSSEDKQIEQAVDGFLKTYNRDFRVAPRSGLTASLTTLLDRTAAAEKADRERVSKSDHPTDKPHLIEGEIFTSLYEGYDKYKLAGVIRKGDAYLVPVNFSNTTYKVDWQDTFVLKKEQGWKIDNVLFNGKNKPRTYTGTCDMLQAFLKVAAP